MSTDFVASFYARLTARRLEMEENVFAFPPENWNEFQKRLGQWIEISHQLQELQPTLKGLEDDNDKP